MRLRNIKGADERILADPYTIQTVRMELISRDVGIVSIFIMTIRYT